MKNLLNRPENVVAEMQQGLAVLSPGIVRLPGHKAMYRADAVQVRDRQVAMIARGGSGHEPAHVGYIGAGMLSAAVAGEVFTSPDTDSVVAVIKAVVGKRAALLVVKNNTGDRLKFGLAAERARFQDIAVEMIVVHDDVALNGAPPLTGARGLAGKIFIYKLDAAAAGKAGVSPGWRRQEEPQSIPLQPCDLHYRRKLPKLTALNLRAAPPTSAIGTRTNERTASEQSGRRWEGPLGSELTLLKPGFSTLLKSSTR